MSTLGPNRKFAVTAAGTATGAKMTNGTVLEFPAEATVMNGDTLTVTYNVSTTGTADFPSEIIWSTTTGSGTWLGTTPRIDPDMHDWPSADIFDYFARQLAERHPATT
jgi:hypothetical protein